MTELENAKFVAGYNAGYLLEQYEPKLLDKVLYDVKSNSAYISGLHSGQQEFQISKTSLELSNIRRNKEKGKDQREL
jgi:hypothetical protein